LLRRDNGQYIVVTKDTIDPKKLEGYLLMNIVKGIAFCEIQRWGNILGGGMVVLCAEAKADVEKHNMVLRLMTDGLLEFDCEVPTGYLASMDPLLASTHG
jgi:hypothetical protein